MGQLIYLIGASGSGKDSIMQAVREQISDEIPTLFAHRYITRPAELGGENYISLTEKEFVIRQNAGLFAMHWKSHGYCYGIGNEIKNWLNNGFNVVVNGSREYLPVASSLFPNLLVTLVTVSENVLRQRLIQRGRESMEEIEKRLERAKAFNVDHHNLITISNDGLLEDSVKSFIDILTGATKSSSIADLQINN